ncbi:MAG: hypothetical protein ACYSSI_08805 [Planctomycetota bacterium]|jgi:hypothetical protein
MPSNVTDLPKIYEDTNFVSGDSPAILDFNTDLGRNATEGTIINDGLGDFTIAFSSDGITYGEAAIVKEGESADFEKKSYSKLKITWISNSSYRVSVF